MIESGGGLIVCISAPGVSQRFPGRAAAALAADPAVMEKTGTRLKASELATEYGFVDMDEAPPGPP